MGFAKHPVDWTPEKIGRFWDFLSRNKAVQSQWFGFQAGEHVAAVIDQAISFKTIRNLLDLSCGRGDVLAACLKRLRSGQACYGTDFSEKSVQAVNQRLGYTPLFKGAQAVRGYPIAFPDGFFDLVIMTEVVEHLNDRDLDQTLNEVHRVVGPGRFLMISTPNNEDLDAGRTLCPDCGCVFHRWQHVRTWTPSALGAMLDRYGFDVVMCKPMAWAPLKRRILLKLAVRLKLLEPNGIVYIGKKKK